MDWETYVASLSEADRLHAQRLAEEYGQEFVEGQVRYHPVGTVAGLQESLRRKRARVVRGVPGLLESIDIRQPPTGWSVRNRVDTEPDGTLLAQTDITGPNGATGFFERGYHAAGKRLELRSAFLQHRGLTERLPTWVVGGGVPMDPVRGTPTVQYFTLYQFKLLGVPGEPGSVTKIKMSTIQNLETILHLHWLRRRHPRTNLDDLIVHTASVQYAETTAVLCGYRVIEARYVTGGEWEEPIDDLMRHFERGNPGRVAENDQLLACYSLNRSTVMKQNFDIILDVEPS